MNFKVLIRVISTPFCLLSTVILLTACGMFENKHEFDYLKSDSSYDLKLPKGVDEPSNNSSMDVPQVKANSNAKELTVDVVKSLEVPPLLSELKGVDLESNEGLEIELPDTEKPVPYSGKLLTHVRGHKYLRFSSKFNGLWEAVLVALPRMGFDIEKANSDKFSIAIFNRLAVDDPNEEETKKLLTHEEAREEYLVKFSVESDIIDITVNNRNDQIDTSALARQVLAQLQYNLEHP